MPFQIGETVICSVEVRNNAGTLVNPATSMTITIKDPQGGIDVNAVIMTNDAVGKFSYDYQSANKIPGQYKIEYKATDGTRITITMDSFHLG